MNIRRLLWSLLLTIVAVIAASLFYDWLTGSGPNWWLAAFVIVASTAGSVWGEWSRSRRRSRG